LGVVHERDRVAHPQQVVELSFTLGVQVWHGVLRENVKPITGRSRITTTLSPGRSVAAADYPPPNTCGARRAKSTNTNSAGEARRTATTRHPAGPRTHGTARQAIASTAQASAVSSAPR